MTLPQAEPRRLTVGLQPVREAIRAHGAAVHQVLLADRARDSQRLEALERFARDQGIAQIRRVPARDLDALAETHAHQGAAAWVPPLRLLELAEVASDHDRLVLALDGIQDPQNFGAVIRSAVGVADAVVLWPENASAPLSLATFRASAGAVEHAHLCQVSSLPEALQHLAESGFTVIGLDGQAESDLTATPLAGPTCLVVGSEHRGMRRATRKACTAFASVVSTCKIASLNASVAAALALYSATIQRAESKA